MQHNVKLSPTYTERFIIVDVGDSSVGHDGLHLEADVTIPKFNYHMDEQIKLTKALKEFFADYFEEIKIDVSTFSEVCEYEQDLADDIAYENQFAALS